MNGRQQNVCAMVAGHQGIKYIYYIKFVHVDRTRFQKATTAQTQTLWASWRDNFDN
jgi:hypothetical protein